MQVRDVAFGERDDVDAGEAEALEEPGGVFLIAAESVQRLGEDHIESPVQRIAHQRLKTRAEKCRARDGVVRVLVGDRPALTPRERTADPKLICDGRIALIVRRVPRVDADLHDFTSVENFLLAARLAFEELTSRLPREHSYERAKCVIASRLGGLGRQVTNHSRKTSSSLSSFASSFGHDTPANVERRFVIRGVRDGDEWAALSAAPNASRLASSAEGVFGAAIARRHSQRDLIKRSESGSCRNEALERHSEALHIGRCGGRAVRHERDVSNIRLVASAVNGDQTSCREYMI